MGIRSLGGGRGWTGGAFFADRGRAIDAVGNGCIRGRILQAAKAPKQLTNGYCSTQLALIASHPLRRPLVLAWMLHTCSGSHLLVVFGPSFIYISHRGNQP